MARRTPRSEANDTSAAAPPARPERSVSRRRSTKETVEGAEAPGAPEADETFAARRDPSEERPSSDEAYGGMAGPDSATGSIESEPREEDIRVRAYHRYLERGGSDGLHFEDWLEAERELKPRR